MTEIEKSGGNVPVRVLGADDRLQAWFDEAIAVTEREPDVHVWPRNAPPPTADAIYAQLRLITGSHYGPGDELPDVNSEVVMSAELLAEHAGSGDHRGRGTSFGHNLFHGLGGMH